MATAATTVAAAAAVATAACWAHGRCRRQAALPGCCCSPSRGTSARKTAAPLCRSRRSALVSGSGAWLLRRRVAVEQRCGSKPGLLLLWKLTDAAAALPPPPPCSQVPAADCRKDGQVYRPHGRRGRVRLLPLLRLPVRANPPCKLPAHGCAACALPDYSSVDGCRLRSCGPRSCRGRCLRAPECALGCRGARPTRCCDDCCHAPRPLQHD